MELGSLVCTPAAPKCGECPLSTVCAAFAQGLQEQLPRAKPKQSFTQLHEAAVVVRKNGSVLLRQCGEGERWAGLWDFPRFAVEADGLQFVRGEIVAKVHALTGITCEPGAPFKTIKHGVTRYRIRLDCYGAEYHSGRVKVAGNSPIRWVALSHLGSYPLSTTGRKIAHSIKTTTGAQK